jgi:hypothetical protein
LFPKRTGLLPTLCLIIQLKTTQWVWYIKLQLLARTYNNTAQQLKPALDNARDQLEAIVAELIVSVNKIVEEILQK